MAAEVAELVPEDFHERQQEAFRKTEDAHLWVTDLPMCLGCQTVITTAYGGGKVVIELDDYKLVGDTCPECEQMTPMVLEGPNGG